MLRFVILTLLLFGVQSFSFAQHFSAFETENPPKNEFRAVWITTNFGLDFPSKDEPVPELRDRGRDWPSRPQAHSKSTADQQKEELIEIIESADEVGLNAVIFQAVPRGDAFYESERLPWSSILTGTAGEDPGWDPLETLLKEGHKRGLEVHAWYNVGRVGSPEMPMPENEPFHISQVQEDWIETVDNSLWINPGIPAVREWHVQNIKELVDNYNIDAIHLDFIRYPTGGFSSDHETFELYNENNINNLDDWRRDNINEILRSLYPVIKEIKPWIKVGATPVGHYRAGDFPWPALWGFEDVFQDSRAWLEEEVIDYVIPQIYWTIGGEPNFEPLMIDWIQYSSGREVYIGKGPFNSGVSLQISSQIDATREAGGPGSAFFRYEHIQPDRNGQSILDERYSVNMALVPTMDWLNSEVPPIPIITDSEWITDDEYRLEWTEPDFTTSEGDTLVRYAIYRVNRNAIAAGSNFVDEGKKLIAVTGETSFTDSPIPSEEPYTYVITSMNRNYAESLPSELIETMTPRSPEPDIADEFKLYQNYPNPFQTQTNMEFDLVEAATVELTIYNSIGQKISTLTKNELEAGRHSFTFENNGISSGHYVYRITASQPSTGTTLFQETRSMSLVK